MIRREDNGKPLIFANLADDVFRVVALNLSFNGIVLNHLVAYGYSLTALDRKRFNSRA